MRVFAGELLGRRPIALHHDVILQVEVVVLVEALGLGEVMPLIPQVLADGPGQVRAQRRIGQR